MGRTLRRCITWDSTPPLLGAGDVPVQPRDDPAGVRWKTVIAATSGWMAGAIWTAEVPVPMTLTRMCGRRAGLAAGPLVTTATAVALRAVWSWVMGFSLSVGRQ
jgi:hypothetical protein